ncbi:hypothetical protein CRE_05742 [Caenorhabditis remanei]|uniref:Uncharacterized protein n=2 Tax=Caenorhabditis remanei TaxID=31234 RepID=E3LZU9_CAERE|nr:hypothetical protein CRE_05742 [Caenorhabditis remanei]
MQINRSRNTENSSGYSSIKTSPQSSDEDLVNARWNKIRLELKPRNPLLINAETEEASTESDDADIRDDAIKETTEIDGELEGDFRPVWTPNELDPHREWYDKLLTFRIEYQKGERGAFPPFPPPPLPSALIAASEATSYNSFDAVKQAATVLSSKAPTTLSLEVRAYRFSPADFQPLPPPHVYIEMIKTLAPHQYIDLTYALAGSALLDMGVKVPERYPPLPPKIEPFRDLEAEERAHMTEMSSQSSSEGEYSDASEHSRFIEKLKKRKNRERRAAREVRIAAKKLTINESAGIYFNIVEPKRETFSRESIYKEKTLSMFIPRRINRGPPAPPFFCPPNVHNKRGAIPPLPFTPFLPMMIPVPVPISTDPTDFKMDYPYLFPMVPISLLSPPETPSSSTVSLCNNTEEVLPDSQEKLTRNQLELEDE